MAVAGPFGTFTRLSFGPRLLYWATIVGVAILLGRVIRATLEQALAGKPFLVKECIIVGTITVVLAAVLSHISPLLLTPIGNPVFVPWQFVIYVFVVTFAVSAIRNGIKYLIAKRSQPELVQRPRLLDRLPELVQGEVLRLTGQGHHVEIVTTLGSCKTRMRFADAIAEMEPVLGYCTHRSHWVTKAAIAAVEREPGKVYLKLTNGDRVPVSRKYGPQLEEAGLI